MTFRTEHLADGVVLYNADCREVLPTLGKVDAVVTDPQRAGSEWGPWRLMRCRAEARAFLVSRVRA